MTTKSLPIPATSEGGFELSKVLPIAGAHFVHDIYTAGIPALLPVLIEKLSLSLTMAGTLSMFMQLPALFTPFIGYLADRVSLRYFVIFAPALTATLIGSLGFAESYGGIVLLLLATGISIAIFHAPAPAMIARVSGNKVGMGMSLFMAGGELARSIGPILAVWAITTWTLDGYIRIAILGWSATLILYWQLRNISARTTTPSSLKSLRPFLRSMFLPMAGILLLRNFMLVCLTLYLPTYINMQGASLWVAGGALSLLEFAGVGGALLSGTMSDWAGRKRVLLITSLTSSLLLFIFLNVEGWLLVPVLILLGFSALSGMPVMLAIVQEQLPDNRAAGNGIFIAMSFLFQSLATLTIGLIGDRLGLESAFYISAALSVIAIPFILGLPERKV